MRRPSSRCTTPTSACPGVRLAATSSPSAAWRTRSTSSFTTGTATSASSSARRTSRSASCMFDSVRRASPRIVLTIFARRRVRLSSMGTRSRCGGVHFEDARDSTLRRGVSPLRRARVSFLAHALARRERAALRRLGAPCDPRAPRAAHLAGLRHAVVAAAALRLRAGAVDDAVARGDHLLDREPVPAARWPAGAGAGARRAVRAPALSLPRPRVGGSRALHRVPPAPRARDGRLRAVHHRGAARAGHDADGAAPARRGAGRSARGDATAAHHGAAVVQRDPRGFRLPHAHRRDRSRFLGDAVRPRDEVRPQDRVRHRLLVHLRRAPRGPLPLRLARAHRAALDPRGVLCAPARLRRKPLRARSGPDAGNGLGSGLQNVPLLALFTALILLLVLSGFFAMAETGMMAINRYRLRALERTGHRGARLASELLRETDKLLSVLLAGNTLVNAAITMIVGVITIDLFGHDRFALGTATVVVAFMILVFAEITPKVIGARYPEQTALAASYVLKPLVRSFVWMLWIVNLFVRCLLWLLRIPAEVKAQRLSMEELRVLVLESGQFMPKKHQ